MKRIARFRKYEILSLKHFDDSIALQTDEESVDIELQLLCCFSILESIKVVALLVV